MKYSYFSVKPVIIQAEKTKNEHFCVLYEFMTKRGTITNERVSRLCFRSRYREKTREVGVFCIFSVCGLLGVQ